jgi:ring-1,2-phenylacetyl-CoA epoxidase subunit PaaE
MRMVVFALEEQHIPTANIRKENFNTAQVSIRPAPADKTVHTIHLKMDGKEYKFNSQYPDTILQSAEKNGIALPYSCRNGVCGSCAMHCRKGEVWHSNNEVLTDVELSSGIFLSCTGYPVHADISIEP